MTEIRREESKLDLKLILNTYQVLIKRVLNIVIYVYKMEIKENSIIKNKM